MQFPTAHNDQLFRASDGMLVGVRGGNKVIYGENPCQTEERMFLDESFAIAFLRKIADVDCSARDNGFNLTQNLIYTEQNGNSHAASIDERFGESRIITPPDQNKVLSFKAN